MCCEPIPGNREKCVRRPSARAAVKMGARVLLPSSEARLRAAVARAGTAPVAACVSTADVAGTLRPRRLTVSVAANVVGGEAGGFRAVVGLDGGAAEPVRHL